jgi:trimeric autotransporter adhesin
MTDSQKNGISSAAQGLLIYRTDGGSSNQGFYYKDNWWWKILSSNDNKSFPIGGYNIGISDKGTDNVIFSTASFAYGSGAAGTNNVAIGPMVLSSSNGSGNVAVGSNAMRQGQNGAIHGDYNTGIGFRALSNGDDGSYNTAIGTSSIESTSGSNNSALGYRTLVINSTGTNNTALGYLAGDSNTTGSNNTLIGSNTDVSQDNLTNATAIGYNAQVNASNKIRLGNNAVSIIEGQVGFTNASDRRLKKEIEITKYGLDEVLKLEPVDYILKSNGLKQIGFIAQDVKPLIPEVVTGKEGDLDKGETLGITYTSLIPVLTKAIQEQQKIIQELLSRIEKLEKQ